MMLSISTLKFLVVETSSGDYNFHRWTCKLSDDYSLNSKRTCKPPELHTIMKKCNGTGLVLKICETKNNVWKKCELSIQNSIDMFLNIGRLIHNEFLRTEKYNQIFILTHSLYFFYELTNTNHRERKETQKLF